MIRDFTGDFTVKIVFPGRVFQIFHCMLRWWKTLHSSVSTIVMEPGVCSQTVAGFGHMGKRE
jgi:hypothetical protein